MVTNLRSLLNKICEFKTFVDIHCSDLIAITESWLDEDIPSSMFADPDVYWCYRKDRSSRGGGVCLMIKQCSNLVVTRVVMPSEFVDLEVLAVDISSNNCDVLPFRIVVVYRPPDLTSEHSNLLVSALDWLGNGSVRMCVMGDLNLPAFNWEQFIYPGNNVYDSFADFVCSHGLTQIVEEPTRGSNILDIVLCSDALCCDDVEVLPPISTSDHNTVCFKLNISLSCEQPVSDLSGRRNFAKADWNSICGFLSSVDWRVAFCNCSSAEQLWQAFTGIVEQAIDKFVPFFKHTKHISAPKLYPRRIRKLLSIKRTRWKLYHTYHTPELSVKYKNAAKRCSDAIKNLTVEKEERLCEDANLGSFYKYVNKKLNGSNGIAPLKNKHGILVNDNLSKAELLNEYFSSVFTCDNGIIREEWEIPCTNKVMSPTFVTPVTVSKAIVKLKKVGGAGPDSIPSEFFKNCQNFITYPLSIIFNISLQTGSLPLIWKCAVVTPVFKKGSPSDPANYRPISLTCIACKLLESCIKEDMLSYFVSQKIITKHQHGFLSKRSTSSHLLECSLDWAVAFNAKKPVDVIYLDYAKAFDSVVHNKLLYKLSCYGVCDMVLDWLKDFLSARMQCVRIESSLSTYCAVTSGVPQGSVLGPVLFVLFINDIVNYSDNSVTVKMFADDTKLYTVISDEFSAVRLQSCLDFIYSWSSHWQLKLSPTKCTVMHLNSSKKKKEHLTVDAVYSVCDCVLPVVSTVTDLGVSYDNQFSFRPHINNIVSKASLRAKLILKCFVTRDSLILCKAFCAFVRPILEFSSEIWNPHFKMDIRKIENVQRRFTKAIFPQLTYSERLARLRLQTLEIRRMMADLTVCYKLLNNLIDVDCTNFVVVSTNTHTRGNSLKLAKNHVLNIRDANMFHNRVINFWNKLPDSVVLAMSIYSFKRRLSAFIVTVGPEHFCVN